MFRITRIRIRWISSNQHNSDGVPATPPAQVVGTFRTRWMAGVLRILVLLLGIFALTRLVQKHPIAHTLEPPASGSVALVIEQLNVDSEPIWVAHSPLDIGQAPDLFDNNIDTFIRGQAANPFMLNFEFSQPQAIKGFSMDLGHMDFIIRVQVYGAGSTAPISYRSEYRQQPDIPHIDMAFTRGPQQVKSIHIEIEQLNPPAEVHIHIREVVFKK